MATEIEQFTNSLVDLIGQTPQATDQLREFGRTATDSGIKIGTLSERIRTSTRDVTSFISSFGSFDRLKIMLATAGDSIEQAGAKIFSALFPLSGILPNLTTAFGQFADQGQLAGRQVSTSVERLLPLISKLPGIGPGLAVLTSGMTSSAQSATAMERNLLAVYASGGQLNKFLQSAGENFDNIDDLAASFNEVLYSTSVATGASTKEVSELAMALGRIPGIMDQASITSGQTSESMGQLTDIIKVQSAFGLTQRDVIEQLSFAYNELGLRGDDALGMMAQIARTAQDLQLPMDIVRRYTMDTGRAFMFFGDNTQAAVNILSKLAPALQDSGLGPEAIRQITGSVTEALANLNVGQRAFVSSLGGGPGGLTGALRLQYALQQGRGAEVFQMFEQAFRRAAGGGPIVTLQQAATTPGMEGQYLKQVELLRQVFGVRGSEQQVSRLIDALAKPGAGPAADRSEILKEAINQGTSVQEKMATAIDQSAAYLERIAMLSAINNAISLRQAFGTAGTGAVADIVKGAMATNARIAGTISVIAEGSQSRTSVEEANKSNIEDFKNLMLFAAGKISAPKFTEGSPLSGFAEGMQKFKAPEVSTGGRVETPGTPMPAPGVTVERAPLLTTLAGATAPPPRVTPLTAPLTANQVMSVPTAEKPAGATETAGGAGQQREAGSNELHIVVDTVYYENNMRSIAREEFDKKINSNIEKSYTGSKNVGH